MINKTASIKVSERVFDILGDALDYAKEDNRYFSAWLETFYNCREQGYKLAMYDEHNIFGEDDGKHYKPIYAWVFECRNSDEIVVIIDNEEEGDNMFTENAYYNKVKHFEPGQYQEAADYIYEYIEKAFEWHK